MNLPAFRLSAPLPRGTVVEWQDDHGDYESVITTTCYDRRRSGNGKSERTGGWSQPVGDDGRMVTHATETWRMGQPHPADWVLVGSEFRPADCPERFAEVDLNENLTAYTKRMKDDPTYLATASISVDAWKAIYVNRSAAGERTRARNAKLRERNDVERLRAMNLRITGRN